MILLDLRTNDPSRLSYTSDIKATFILDIMIK